MAKEEPQAGGQSPANTTTLQNEAELRETGNSNTKTEKQHGDVELNKGLEAQAKDLESCD